MPLPNEQENPQSSDWLDWGFVLQGDTSQAGHWGCYSLGSRVSR